MLESLLSSFCFCYLAIIHSWCFYTTTMQPRNSFMGRCVTLKQTRLSSTEMMIHVWTKGNFSATFWIISTLVIAKGIHKLYMHRFTRARSEQWRPPMHSMTHLRPWRALHSLHLHRLFINCWLRDPDLTWQCSRQISMCLWKCVYCSCIGPAGALGWFVVLLAS